LLDVLLYVSILGAANATSNKTEASVFWQVYGVAAAAVVVVHFDYQPKEVG
jgi:hypothetical protein